MAINLAQSIVNAGAPYLLQDTDLRGGFRIVATVAERNSIPLQARKQGMRVLVQENSTEYMLNGSIANTSWIVKPEFVGSFVSAESINVVSP